MSLHYLLDTNVVSAPLKPSTPPAVFERIRAAVGECAIAAPTWHELRYGLALLPDSRKKEGLREYLDDVVLSLYPLLEYDKRAAEWHAGERARLRQLGVTPPHVDAQIAAIAASNGLVLVTHNAADFVQFDGLEVEDWFPPPRR